ncbi:hypothetical protein V5O48_005859 [Marasmius crinis-equi]|uniref:Uncharacterized protein n=1 Tax=Marasmius crinis-equi TaxID=585013 RepID=A0ABR3FLI5_9AGAR
MSKNSSRRRAAKDGSSLNEGGSITRQRRSRRLARDVEREPTLLKDEDEDEEIDQLDGGEDGPMDIDGPHLEQPNPRSSTIPPGARTSIKLEAGTPPITDSTRTASRGAGTSVDNGPEVGPSTTLNSTEEEKKPRDRIQLSFEEKQRERLQEREEVLEREAEELMASCSISQNRP